MSDTYLAGKNKKKVKNRLSKVELVLNYGSQFFEFTFYC